MPEKPSLEDLIHQRQAELLELLAACRTHLPREEVVRHAPQLEFLEGLVRLDTDRALKAVRDAERRRQAENQTLG